MFEDLGRVIAGAIRIARRLPERSAARADGDPRVRLGRDALDVDRQRIAAVGAFNKDGTSDRVDQRRAAVEPGALRRDRLIRGRLEVAGAGVPGLDLKRLAGTDAQQRFVAPVEGELPREVAGDSLHGSTLRNGKHSGQIQPHLVRSSPAWVKSGSRWSGLQATSSCR